MSKEPKGDGVLVFPPGQLVASIDPSPMGFPVRFSRNVPDCPECSEFMVVIEQQYAFCLTCGHRQPYPWKVPRDDKHTEE